MFLIDIFVVINNSPHILLIDEVELFDFCFAGDDEFTHHVIGVFQSVNRVMRVMLMHFLGH